MRYRIKELRKTLGLSQATFGEKIGISQQAVAAIESGKAKLADRNFSNICRSFNVNPTWLESGKGAMFNALDQDFLEQLATEKNLDSRTKSFIGSLLEIPPKERSQLIDAMLALVSAAKAVPATAI